MFAADQACFLFEHDVATEGGAWMLDMVWKYLAVQVVEKYAKEIYMICKSGEIIFYHFKVIEFRVSVI